MKTKLLTLIPIIFFFSCDSPTEHEHDELTYYDLYCNQGYVELWGNYFDIETTTEVNLSNNEISGIIPSHIGCLENLTYLSLVSNDLTGEIPPEIGNLTNLTYLNLGSNELTGEIPPEIGNLVNLEYLNLGYSRLTGEIPLEIGNLTSLTYLNLGWNYLTGEIPSEICNQGDSSPTVTSNQLCPPYPECIEIFYGFDQDISNCGD
jgi:Leucine-rich repeat (LRR) protein